VSAPPIELHIERRGHGPPLVLLHGWSMNLRVFDVLAAQLESHFELIAVDLPGHGRSASRALPADIDTLAAALRPCVPPEAIVLGWSLGGMAALALASSDGIASPPLARLVIIASTPCFVARADWPHGMAPAVLDGFAARLRAEPHATVHDFLELQLRGSPQPAAMLRAQQAALESHGSATDAALATGLELLRETDMRERLPGIDLPALVIAGQYDRVTHPGAGRALAAALPRGEYVEFSRTGHAPMLSHPIELAAKIVEFAAKGCHEQRKSRKALSARAHPDRPALPRRERHL
jgi:pimeloyl-[acyl-carrier protein] methyl ester esterase